MTDSYSEVPHPLQRRLLAEELLLRRLADNGRRFAASQRRDRIDPNPHQIDAVVFALRRIPYPEKLVVALHGLRLCGLVNLRGRLGDAMKHHSGERANWAFSAAASA